MSHPELVEMTKIKEKIAGLDDNTLVMFLSPPMFHCEACETEALSLIEPANLVRIKKLVRLLELRDQKRADEEEEARSRRHVCEKCCKDPR